jgi:ABC-2 type transport system permease protein
VPPFMRVFSILYRKELRSYLLNPLGWIVIAFVIIMHGISLSTAMKAFSDTPMANSLVYVSMHTPVFWFYFMVIFPLLTMKLFADEQRSGTLETLLTAPVKTWQVVLSKYCAVLTFYCLLWVPSYFQFQFYTWTTDLPPAWNNGSLIGTYAILFLMGAFFLAIGCLASSLTSNSIVAAIVTLGLLLLNYFLGFVTTIWGENFAGAALFNYISSKQHLHYFCSGLLDTRVVVLYLSLTVLILALTFHVLDFRRWRR